MKGAAKISLFVVLIVGVISITLLYNSNQFVRAENTTDRLFAISVNRCSFEGKDGKWIDTNIHNYFYCDIKQKYEWCNKISSTKINCDVLGINKTIPAGAGYPRPGEIKKEGYFDGYNYILTEYYQEPNITYTDKTTNGDIMEFLRIKSVVSEATILGWNTTVEFEPNPEKNISIGVMRENQTLSENPVVRVRDNKTMANFTFDKIYNIARVNLMLDELGEYKFGWNSTIINFTIDELTSTLVNDVFVTNTTYYFATSSELRRINITNTSDTTVIARPHQTLYAIGDWVLAGNSSGLFIYYTNLTFNTSFSAIGGVNDIHCRNVSLIGYCAVGRSSGLSILNMSNLSYINSTNTLTFPVPAVHIDVRNNTIWSENLNISVAVNVLSITNNFTTTNRTNYTLSTPLSIESDNNFIYVGYSSGIALVDPNTYTTNRTTNYYTSSLQTDIANYNNTGAVGSRTSIIDMTTTAGIWGNGVNNNIIDGSQGNSNWFSVEDVAEKYIEFDFRSPKLITEAIWYQSISDNNGVWKWQGSTDNSSWSDIGSTFSLGSGSATTVQTSLSENLTAYRYYRMIGVSGSKDADAYIREIEFKIFDTGSPNRILAGSSNNIQALSWNNKVSGTKLLTGSINLTNSSAGGLSIVTPSTNSTEKKYELGVNEVLTSYNITSLSHVSTNNNASFYKFINYTLVGTTNGASIIQDFSENASFIAFAQDGSGVAISSVSVTLKEGVNTRATCTTNSTGYCQMFGFSTAVNYDLTSIKTGYDSGTNNTQTPSFGGKLISLSMPDTTSPTSLRFIQPTRANNTDSANYTLDIKFQFTESNPDTSLLQIGFPNGTYENRTASTSGNIGAVGLMALPDGWYNFTMFANDTAGNWGKNSSYYNISVTRDIIAPSNFRWVNPTRSNNTNSSNSTLDLAFQLSEANPDTAFLQVGSPDGAYTNYTADLLSGIARFSLSSLSDDSHNFSMFANDTINNQGTNSTLYKINIDTTFPTSLRFIQPTRANNTDSTNTTLDLAFTFTETNPHISQIQIGFPNGTYENRTSSTSGTTGRLSLKGLENGLHNFSMYANDTANNQAKNSSFYNISITQDSTVPSAFRFINPTRANNTNSSNSTLDLAFQLSEANPDTALLQVGSPDGAYTNYTATPSSGIARYSLSSLSNGGHNFTMFANDTSGNQGTNNTIYRMVIDSTGSYPDLVPDPPTNLRFISPTPTNNSNRTNTSIDISFRFSDIQPRNGILQIGFPNGSLSNITSSSSPQGDYPFLNAISTVSIFALSGLNSGSHNFTMFANDWAGGEARNSTFYTITIDNTFPDSLRYVSPTPTNNTNVAGTNLTMAFDFNETNPDTSLFEVGFPNGTLKNRTAIISSSTATINLTGLASGNHNFSIYVNDTANNWGSNKTYYVLNMGGSVTLANESTISSVNAEVGKDIIIYVNISATGNTTGYNYTIPYPASRVNISSIQVLNKSNGNISYNLIFPNVNISALNEYQSPYNLTYKINQTLNPLAPPCSAGYDNYGSYCSYSLIRDIDIVHSYIFGVNVTGNETQNVSIIYNISSSTMLDLSKRSTNTLLINDSSTNTTFEDLGSIFRVIVGNNRTANAYSLNFGFWWYVINYTVPRSQAQGAPAGNTNPSGGGGAPVTESKIILFPSPEPGLECGPAKGCDEGEQCVYITQQFEDVFGEVDYQLVETFPTNIKGKIYSTQNTPYANKWTIEKGGWIFDNGVLKNLFGSAPDSTDYITLNEYQSTPGKAIRSKVMGVSGNWKYSSLIMGLQDINNFYRLTLSTTTKELQLQKRVNGQNFLLNKFSIPSMQQNTFYDMEFKWISQNELEGVLYDLQGNILGRVQATASELWTSGKFGLSGTRGVSKAVFDDVRIGTGSGQTIVQTVRTTIPPSLNAVGNCELTSIDGERTDNPLPDILLLDRKFEELTSIEKIEITLGINPYRPPPNAPNTGLHGSPTDSNSDQDYYDEDDDYDGDGIINKEDLTPWGLPNQQTTPILGAGRDNQPDRRIDPNPPVSVCGNSYCEPGEDALICSSDCARINDISFTTDRKNGETRLFQQKKREEMTITLQNRESADIFVRAAFACVDGDISCNWFKWSDDPNSQTIIVKVPEGAERQPGFTTLKYYYEIPEGTPEGWYRTNLALINRDFRTTIPISINPFGSLGPLGITFGIFDEDLIDFPNELPFFGNSIKVWHLLIIIIIILSGLALTGNKPSLIIDVILILLLFGGKVLGAF